MISCVMQRLIRRRARWISSSPSIQRNMATTSRLLPLTNNFGTQRGLRGAAGRSSLGLLARRKSSSWRGRPTPSPRTDSLLSLDANHHLSSSSIRMMDSFFLRQTIRCFSSSSVGVGVGVEGLDRAEEDGNYFVDVEKHRDIVLAMRRRHKAWMTDSGRLKYMEEKEGRKPFGESAFVKVFVDASLREALGLVRRERKGRLLLDLSQPTLASLTQALHDKFPVKGLPFTVHARVYYPETMQDASVGCVHEGAHLPPHGASPQEDVIAEAGALKWKLRALGLEGGSVDFRTMALRDDEGVRALYAELKHMGIKERSPHSTERNVGGSCELHIMLRPGTRLGVKHPVENLPAPDTSLGWRMVSMYAFNRVSDTHGLAARLEKAFKQFGALGRVYVAEEGVNAQVSVAANLLPHMNKYLLSVEELRGGVPNVDCDAVPDQGILPFVGLHVRVRHQVVADGFEKALDWADCGPELDSASWHEEVKRAKQGVGAGVQKTLLLDCRNSYESDVGRFDGALPILVDNFRESWSYLDKMLEDQDRENTKLLIYCTGGIRCVKVGAYLKQKLGFSDVNRLKGGIVSYVRDVKDQGTHEGAHEGALPGPFADGSLFKGINYVFDGRVGSAVTEDLPAEACEQGPVRAAEMQRERRVKECIMTSRMWPMQGKKAAGGERYLSMFASQGPLWKTLFPKSRNSARSLVVAPRVAVAEASSLRLPCKLQAGSSTFCGSSLKLASEPHAGSGSAVWNCGNDKVDGFCESFSKSASLEEELLTSILTETQLKFPRASHMCSGRVQGGLLHMLCEISNARRVLEIGCFTGYAAICMASASCVQEIVTLEKDVVAAELAQKNFARSKYGGKVKLIMGNASESLERLWQAREDPFDLVFLDADKNGYAGYRDVLAEKNILKVGGLVVTDNVLWKGQAVEEWLKHPHSHTEDLRVAEENEGRNERRNSKLAKSMVEFLRLGAEPGSRWEQVVLAVRDGLCISRRVL